MVCASVAGALRWVREGRSGTLGEGSRVCKMLGLVSASRSGQLRARPVGGNCEGKRPPAGSRGVREPGGGLQSSRRPGA